MNNKETLQQHNIRLSENNIDLKSLFSKVNNLPNKVTVDNHYLEGQNVVIILSDGTKLIIDISEYINNNNIGTIAEIEQLIVSCFENKTVKEVEK